MSLAAAVLAALSAVHFAVTTADATAQMLVDRGLFYYYAYDRGDAAQAFAAAAARDPQLAMAYWGEALADGPDLNTPMSEERFVRGRIAIEKAQRFESGATESERRFVDAMALRYRGSWDDWARDDAAYRTAIALVADDTGSDDARMLAAEALLEHGGLAWEGSLPVSADSRHALDLVDATLAHDPANLMANHLCIHLYDEATADRKPAYSCARQLDAAALPPQAEHLAHMPAHYWIEAGNYAAASASSERAYGLFVQLERNGERDPEHDHYLIHDVFVGYSARMMLANYGNARRWSARMDAAYATPFDGLTALRFGRFDDAYRLATDSSPSSLAVRGYAALELERIADARDAAARLAKLSTPGYLADLFVARLLERDGDYDGASRRIDRAVREQAAAFSGELIPLLPALEARGGLALRRRAYADAQAAYRDALVEYPNDPRALFGLAQALKGLGNDAEAIRIRQRFDATWGTPDAPFEL